MEDPQKRAARDIYAGRPLEEIPWNVEEPPPQLRELVESGRIPPCKAADMGCGLGNYAIYLAGKGFDVTGVDISPTAIAAARENARKKGVKCRFVLADMLGDLEELGGGFDFIYDWGVLHHVMPEDRGKYVGNAHRLLRPGGFYLSVCFSEKDTHFGGAGKYRKTSLGTFLYFSSEAEMRELFEPRFEIEELKTIRITGKNISHYAVYAFMRKRG